ncbi:cytochrome P450 [Suillus bovinus]|uniref:cytochrome P450 n=1 Tax=Suillus bovinus TaxID=48563 RepID=UPI001B85EF32|nr:cytochrome P450 [Suillus bovinus]KAG2157942.1 cytochrome P450 [Suillus bovinus]
MRTDKQSSRREVIFPQPLEHKCTKGTYTDLLARGSTQSVNMISGAVICLVTFFAYIAWRNTRRYTLKDIQGPPSHSFWLGSEKVHRHAKQVGELEFQWAREYGLTWMVKGCLGEEVLWTADPRALQYVFHTSGYRFSKRTVATETTRLFTGESILTAEAVDHQRHRKIMNPAFGAAQLRTFLPVFRRSAARLSQKWKDMIQLGENSDGCTMNVSETLSRMTLDVIGEVAFDHRFGVLNDNGVDNELVQAFNNLFIDTLLNPSSWDLIFKSTWRFFPGPVLRCLKYLPYKEYRRFSTYLQTAIQTGNTIINEKAASTEKGSKDIISILVQSNHMEDARAQLSEREILSQIATLLVAGHDTTASSLTWLLYELSKHPEDQRRIRDEIKTARLNVEARGDDDLLPSDFNNMDFTNAVIKEGLRLHPIVPTLVREADSDDVIPLSQPIKTRSGKIINEIAISKGQGITASICTYNRLQSIWGEDADEWNPNRFLDNGREKSSLGVFANLPALRMTFSAGLRACIGWRFAVLEMQAVLVELVENFEYRFPEGVEIIRLNAGLMAPMVEGKMHEGVQMPLEVSIIA